MKSHEIAALCRVALTALGKPLRTKSICDFALCLSGARLDDAEHAVVEWAKKQPDKLEPPSLEDAAADVIVEDWMEDCMGHPERGKPGERLVSVPARKIADLRRALERHCRRSQSKDLCKVVDAARKLCADGWGPVTNDDPTVIVRRGVYMDLRQAVEKLLR